MLYATITEFLGYKANSDEWKVMAISNLMALIMTHFTKNLDQEIINFDNKGNYQLNLQLLIHIIQLSLIYTMMRL